MLIGVQLCPSNAGNSRRRRGPVSGGQMSPGTIRQLLPTCRLSRSELSVFSTQRACPSCTDIQHIMTREQHRGYEIKAARRL